MVKHEREGNGARESETEIDPEKKKTGRDQDEREDWDRRPITSFMALETSMGNRYRLGKSRWRTATWYFGKEGSSTVMRSGNNFFWKIKTLHYTSIMYINSHRYPWTTADVLPLWRLPFLQEPGHHGASWKCRISGPTPELWIWFCVLTPKWFTCTL